VVVEVYNSWHKGGQSRGICKKKGTARKRCLWRRGKEEEAMKEEIVACMLSMFSCPISWKGVLPYAEIEGKSLGETAWYGPSLNASGGKDIGMPVRGTKTEKISNNSQWGRSLPFWTAPNKREGEKKGKTDPRRAVV